MNVVKIIMSVEEDQNNSSEIEQLVNEYSNIFDRIGQFTGEYYFILHLDAEPVVHPHRRVPMALRDKSNKSSTGWWKLKSLPRLPNQLIG